jgi:transposase
MHLVYERCCGLDVHKNLVVACLSTPDALGHRVKQVRTFQTTTADLLALGDWLNAAACTHVAMEATGVYWKPLYNVLADAFVLLVVNAQHIKAVHIKAVHIKAVPGRKTDVRDAEWIADLLQHGVLRGSFIPPAAQRELRDLTRYRTTLVSERARTINRLQKTLEDTNLKLAWVVTNILGKSARAMLDALLAGETDPLVLANLAQGRLRAQRQALPAALVGSLKPHHRFLIAEQLAHIDQVGEAIARVDREIEAHMETEAEAVALLDTIPGISQRAAEGILAEIGTDASRAPSISPPGRGCVRATMRAQANNSMARRARAVHGSANSCWKPPMRLRGQRPISALSTGAQYRRSVPALSTGAQYRRLAKRRGPKKALFAVAHSILVVCFHLFQRHVAYEDLGANFFDEHERAALQKRLVRRLEHLGYQVALQPSPPAA